MSKIVNVSLTTEEIVLDPTQAKGYQQFQVLGLFLENLVRKDPNSGIVSGLAESWRIDSTGTIYNFKIRSDAKFHDSQRITTNDIVDSLNSHLDPMSKSIVGGYIRNVIESIKSVEDEVEIKLKGPYPPFLELIAMSGFGVYKIDPIGNIIGSGPFKLSQSEGKKWCLTKSKEYFGYSGTIEEFCFIIERDPDITVELLNSREIDLALGAPLEVALSKNLQSELISSPLFSMVTTNCYINHTDSYFHQKSNREKIYHVLKRLKKKNGILTKFDRPLETFLPVGLASNSYYSTEAEFSEANEVLPEHAGRKLKIVFPYGIYLESAVHLIVKEFESVGYEVSFKNVKGKALLDPILSGDYDLIFIPYQGVISDPDGLIDLLNPTSLLKSAKIPSSSLLAELDTVRFDQDRSGRLDKYEKAFKRWESELSVIPFSQNGIPIVYNSRLRLPDLNYSFHLSLRDVELK